MNPMLTRCPVCGGELSAISLDCPSCDAHIDGSFSPVASPLREAFSAEQLRPLLPLARLVPEQLAFVVAFMRCEGRFNRLEEELGLSYPTLRGRLDGVIQGLGLSPPGGTGGRALPDPAARQEIFDLLNSGAIAVDEACRRLRGEPVRAAGG